MRWKTESNPWRKKFAFLPVTLSEGIVKESIWLEWYWCMDLVDGVHISFTNPLVDNATQESAE